MAEVKYWASWLGHMFLQKVLRWRPTCACCDLTCRPIYDGIHCEICPEWSSQGQLGG